MPVPAPQAPGGAAGAAQRRAAPPHAAEQGRGCKFRIQECPFAPYFEIASELADSGVPVTGQGPGRPQAAPRAPFASCPRFYIKSDSALKPLIHDTSKIATPRLVIRVQCRPRCHGAVSHPRPSARAAAVAAAAATPTADAALVTTGAPVAAELAAASRHDRPSSTRRDAVRRGATARLLLACLSRRTIRGLSRTRSSAAAGG